MSPAEPGRVRFLPEPITWHVPPSQRGYIELAPEQGHRRLIQFRLYPDGPADSPSSLVLTRADIRRLTAVLARLVTDPGRSRHGHMGWPRAQR
jgi:hypothetical protein